jgi:hypothetical protein
MFSAARKATVIRSLASVFPYESLFRDLLAFAIRFTF